MPHKIGLTEEVFKDAEFERYDKYHSEDLIYGTLKNDCKFAMSEILTQKRCLDKENIIDYSIAFSGLLAKIETPKKINTLFYLRDDRNDQGLINKTVSNKVPFDKLRIQLDSSEFEKIFDVYASDKIFAMQLLTADIMQDLVLFHNEMGIYYELTIKENYMYIRFWCGKMFETAKSGKFSLDRDTLYNYYRMLDFTFKLTNKMVKVINEMQYD